MEFTGLPQSERYLESDLEQALIDKLREFLLELGKGFAFMARQQRITLDGQHYWIDLVFYNRLTRSFVLIDLKVGTLTHQDLGQMQMYVNYYQREITAADENPPIGIVLCTDKSEAVVRYTLPEDNQQIFASRYKLYLPTETELAAEVAARAAGHRNGRPSTRRNRPVSHNWYCVPGRPLRPWRTRPGRPPEGPPPSCPLCASSARQRMPEPNSDLWAPSI